MKYVYIALMVVMIVGNAGGYWMRSHRHWIFRDCSTLPLKPNTLDCQDSSDSFLTNHDRFKHLTKEISTKIDNMKEILKHKRYELSHLREKKFEGGKSECLKVQYEVREFLARKAHEQQQRVTAKRQELMIQLLPLLDSFQAVRQSVPPSSEREGNMHNAYEVVLGSLVLLLEKYGHFQTRLVEESNDQPTGNTTTS